MMTIDVNDNVNLNSEEKKDDVLPIDIGSAFVHQYYTFLADNPGSVHRFYGHESTLTHNESNLVGQQTIGSFIESEFSGHGRPRIKIFSIKGVPTFNKGIVLQVCGEISSRRFFQTFVLATQGANRFYVQNDIFQYLDLTFDFDHMNVKEITTTDLHHQEPVVEKPVLLNGSAHHEVETTPVPVATPTPVSNERVDPVVPVVSKNVPATNGTPSKHEQERHGGHQSHKHNHSKRDDHHKKEDTRNHHSASAAPAPPIVPPVVDSTPKTWAKLVGTTPKPNTHPPQQPTSAKNQLNGFTPISQAQQTTKTTFNKQNHNNGFQKIDDAERKHEKVGNVDNKQQQQNGERRIYLGSIIRNVVPENTGSAEQEIKTIFSKFGTVDHVAIPRKVLDQPHDITRHGFAFITMHTVADAQNVYKMANKDERGAYSLNLKIDAFGFKGDATISEQKDRVNNDRPNGGFRGRGGVARGFVSRGMGGRGRGGFSRGAHNNNHSNVNTVQQPQSADAH